MISYSKSFHVQELCGGMCNSYPLAQLSRSDGHFSPVVIVFVDTLGLLEFAQKYFPPIQL